MENGYVAYLYLNFKKKNTLKEIIISIKNVTQNTCIHNIHSK